MRGFSFLLSSGLVALVGIFGCGRLDFERLPGPDATADGGLDSAAPRVDGGFDAAVDSTMPRDSATDAPPADGARDSGSVDDAGDSGMGDASLPPGRVTVADFTAGWATEASVYWTWTFAGVAADFDRFEIVTGPTEAAVRARDATTVATGPAHNPELAGLVLPGSSDRVEHTLTFGHPPGAAVYGQLIAYDTVGGASLSTVAVATTLTPTSELVLFADADTRGFSTPTTFTRSTSGPYRGTHCYSYPSVCSPGMCFDNLRRQGVGIDLSAVPVEAFDRAFYEFAVEIDGVGAEPSYWSEARFAFGGEGPFAFSWLTIPARAGYRVIQIPLRELNWAGTNLDHATATGTNLGLFWIGGTWSNGSTVRLDEARIRW